MIGNDASRPAQPLRQFFAALAGGGFETDEAKAGELAALFEKAPYSYFLDGFPCPQYDHMDPATPAAGQKLDVYFYPDTFDIPYTVAVTDNSLMVPKTRYYTDTPTSASPSPFKITVPAKDGATDIFVAGHAYTIALYPSFFGLPIGCITWLPVAVGGSEYTKAALAALQLRPPIALITPQKQTA